MKRKKIAYFVPFIGDGKLSPYKERKDSWVLDQMDTGKVNPGIDVSNDGFIRFSMLKKRIAAKIVLAADEQITISRQAKTLSSTTANNYRFKLSWKLSGNLNGCTLSEIALASDLLFSKSSSDLQDINCSYVGSIEKDTNPRIDFENKCINIDTVVTFEVSILADNTKIKASLEEMGFVFGDLA